jgi:hypothetical protein
MEDCWQKPKDEYIYLTVYPKASEAQTCRICVGIYIRRRPLSHVAVW